MGKKSKDKEQNTKPKKENQKEGQKEPKKSNPEVTGLIIVAISFLFALSIYSDGSAELLKASKDFFGGILGTVIYLVPPIVFIYGILVMFQKADFTFRKKLILLIVLFICIGALIHNNYNDFTRNIPLKYDVQSGKIIGTDYNKFSKELYDNGISVVGGGVLGGLLSYWLVKLVGVSGSNVIIITIILILSMQLTNISFVKLILGIKKYSVLIAKLLYSSVKFIINIIKDKIPEKSDNSQSLAMKLDEPKKSVDLNKKSIAKELEEIKDIVPEKVSPPKQAQFEQQEISEIKIKEMKTSVKENIDNKPEKVDIKVATGNYGDYKLPSTNLLNKPQESEKPKNGKKEILENAKKLEETLKSFGVDARVVEVHRGPTVTRYELQPNVGVKVSKIVSLSDDIALNLAASGIRIEAPIPGKAAVGIEVPNKEISSVFLREIVESENFINHPSKISFGLGKDIGGECIVADIAKMPHVLIAGATGSGKSVCINTLIASILLKAAPNEVKLLMVDPKVVELGVYNGIPHLLIPVVTEPKKAAGALNWAVQEMISRYKTFAEHGVRDIKGYNTLVKDTDKVLPQIVIIIDELADLMAVAANDVEEAIQRLAQMARAAGMHLVIATQRPSVDVITGVIKANITSRISFAVSSQVDSRTILDSAGAEKLLGRGDMLFYPVGEAKPIRVQGAFISDKEVEAIVEHIKSQGEEVKYSEEIIEKINAEKETTYDPGDNDELLPQAIEIILESGQASVSMLQRRLKIGYARAARLIDQMEARSIVGGFEGSKPRQVLISKEDFYGGHLDI